MSQDKVDRYKEKKANRKVLAEKEKKKAATVRAALIGVIALVVVGAVGAIGLTIRNEYKAYQESLPTYTATSYIVPDNAGVLEDAE